LDYEELKDVFWFSNTGPKFFIFEVDYADYSSSGIAPERLSVKDVGVRIC